MPLLLGDTLQTRSRQDGVAAGSVEWNVEVFERAYASPAKDGPMDLVAEKLANGFSVLVYLPGTCMAAAAAWIGKRLPGHKWIECGEHPGNQEGIPDAWSPGAGFVDQIRSWLSLRQNTEPRAVFHNIDLLVDAQGGVRYQAGGFEALFSLIEATRRGVVLGLADREVGSLPAEFERAFPEIVRFDEIPPSGVARIIPGELLAGLLHTQNPNTKVPESLTSRLSMRLRSADPLHAVKLLTTVMEKFGTTDLDGLLRALHDRMRPAEYLMPTAEMREGDLRGFSKVHTLGPLLDGIVEPYAAWLRSTRTRGVSSPRLLEKGVILYGPPGTGKTTLARWIAGQLDVPVRVVSPAEIKTRYYGDAERNMCRLFQAARRAAPCVVVLDDADDLFPPREQAKGATAGADIGVVNAALQELEGFHGSMTGVLVILTTNRFDSLDEAMRQRLSFHVRVPFPLGPNQVGEVIDRAAGGAGLVLSHGIRADLVAFFMEPMEVVPGQPAHSPAWRLAAEEGLFSSRVIAAGVRRLRPGANTDEGYEPRPGDVERMTRYLRPRTDDMTE